MAKASNGLKEKKNLGTGKIILIVIIVFTFLPITIMSMLYFTNENFKYIAHDYLKGLPGSLGQHFDKYPTREEKETQKREVAKYLTTIEPDIASDKLLIIQNSSTALYGELIQLMRQIDTKSTETILERVRDRSIKDDVLVTTINQFRNDELMEIKEKSQYYEKLDLHDAITDIHSNLVAEKISYRELTLIIDQMKEDYAVMILSRLEEDVSKNIISNIPNQDKRVKITDMINKEKLHKVQLINQAQMYNTENPDKLQTDLGSNEKYKTEELSLIYRNMDTLQGGKILSKVNDKKFVYSLFEQLKKDELFENGPATFTQELISTTSIFQAYEEKVSEFINVCTKMETPQVVELIQKLYKSDQTPQKYFINDDLSLSISDRDLAISILSRLKPKLVADILSNMDGVTASEISKSITLP